MKKLKINYINDDFISDKIHLDRSDVVLSKEHLNFYLIVKIHQSSMRKSSRLYLSHKHQNEYYRKKFELGNPTYNKKFEVSKLHLFDLYPKYINFIKLIIIEIFTEHIEIGRASEILHGIGLFIDTLKEECLNFKSATEIKVYHQQIAYKNHSKKIYKSKLSTFFHAIKTNFPTYSAIKTFYKKRKKIKALPSSTVYQIDYFTRYEIEDIIKRKNEYDKWIEEFKTIKNFFSLENLAKTYYHRCEYFKNEKIFTSKLNSLCIVLHNTNLKCWYRIRDGEYKYKTEKDRLDHLKLLKLSKKGINIDIVNEKMFAFWHKAILPNWPFDKKINKKFTSIYPKSDYLRRIATYRLKLNLKEFDARIFPSLHQIYPLILFLLIREGLNAEVLRNFCIRKNSSEHNYELVAEETKLALIINSNKNRSNSNIDVVISPQSEQKKFIDFFLKWLSKTYDNSKSKSFFQYISIDTTNIIQTWNNVGLFKEIKRSKYTLFYKYEITDLKGLRIYNIDHRRIRPYTNYADYMRGLNEFERQFKKGHKNIDTLLHYENNTEWENERLYKIAKTQNLLIKIFKGSIVRDHKLFNLFEGPLANCSNPFKPSHPSAQKLSKNEVCTDWTKCLTLCNKSIVIPEIHAEVILAWLKFIEEEKENFLTVKDWENEYLLDEKAAKSVYADFTDDEKKLAEQNAFKYKSFVKQKFKKKIKIEDKNGYISLYK